MSLPDERMRQLLGPRPLAGRGPTAPAPRPPPRRSGLRFAAALTLLAVAAAAAAGKWLWQSSRGRTAPASAPLAQQVAPRAEAAAADMPLVAADTGPARASAPLASISELLQRPASARWRWDRFKANPAIVVIEYPNLHEQGRAMNRLAAMFEKRAAHRDRVLTERELDDLIRRSSDNVATFYQGHDYAASSVARFFSQAEAQGAALNAQEMQLRSLLTEAGLMARAANGAFRALGDQAVVSFTAVQPDDPATAPDERVDGVRREAVLRHELSHGQFFVDPGYRAHCMNFWRHVLREHERRLFRQYLKSLDYNPDDEALMANETQAFLMHTPDRRAFDASSLHLGEPALAQLRRRFKAGEPAHGLRSP